MLITPVCRSLRRFGSGLTACELSVFSLKRNGGPSLWGAQKHIELCYTYSPCGIRSSSSAWTRGTSAPPPLTMETDQDNSSSATAVCRHVRSEELSKGKWIALHEITYIDPTGRERKWEALTRTTKTGDGTDAVVIIPILKQRQKADSVLLVKQYRPPLKAYSLEFPAGLIDGGEDPLTCAVRELKEETGYSGTAKSSSPGISLDPGVSSSTVNLVTVEIDGDKEENRNPEQEQEESEFIEVIRVQLNNLLDVLNEYGKEGVIVHSVLYTYALVCAQTASK